MVSAVMWIAAELMYWLLYQYPWLILKLVLFAHFSSLLA